MLNPHEIVWVDGSMNPMLMSAVAESKSPLVWSYWKPKTDRSPLPVHPGDRFVLSGWGEGRVRLKTRSHVDLVLP